MTWLMLILTLPTAAGTARVRIWRALKAGGCAALRDGVYLLPALPASEAVVEVLAEAVREAGGEATVLAVAARDVAQQAQFEALFDRSDEYKAFEVELAQQRRALRTVAAGAGRRNLRALAQRLEALRAVDYFGGARGAQAAAALETLRAACEARWSPGEPRGLAAAGIARLARDSFQGRIWATRRRPWVDRLASAWLILRFVDPAGRIVWLPPKARPPRGALGFDFDGADFSHAAGKVTFEVLAASFDLDGDAALRRLGDAVHYLDIGGAASEEAAGLEAMVRGLQAQHADDDALLAAALQLLDALYSGLRSAA